MTIKVGQRTWISLQVGMRTCLTLQSRIASKTVGNFPIVHSNNFLDLVMLGQAC